MDDKKDVQIEGFDEEKATREAGNIFDRFDCICECFFTDIFSIDSNSFKITR